MSNYYKFFRPYDMKLLSEGKFAEMPFDKINNFEVFDSEDGIDCARTGIMNRKMALYFQSVMNSNKDFFINLMNENNTDSLIYRVEE